MSLCDSSCPCNTSMPFLTKTTRIITKIYSKASFLFFSSSTGQRVSFFPNLGFSWSMTSTFSLSPLLYSFTPSISKICSRSDVLTSTLPWNRGTAGALVSGSGDPDLTNRKPATDLLHQSEREHKRHKKTNPLQWEARGHGTAVVPRTQYRSELVVTANEKKVLGAR